MVGILLLGYDTEYGVWGDPEVSVRAVKAIAKVHENHGAPATFFICGKVLEARRTEFRKILDDDLFDVQSHTYSHIDLRSADLKKVKEEIQKTNELINSIFGKAVKGLRTPGGYYRGLQGRSDILSIIWESGIRFVSSDATGKHGTMPAPFNQPYWYAEDGFPELLEIPVQGWHDNLLKAYAPLGGKVKTMVIWPPITPWPLPKKPPRTPQEEFAVHKKYLDYASENDMIYSPAFHPWSIYRLNPEARTIDLILEYAKKKNMTIITYYDLYKELVEKCPVSF